MVAGQNLPMASCCRPQKAPNRPVGCDGSEFAVPTEFLDPTNCRFCGWLRIHARAAHVVQAINDQPCRALHQHLLALAGIRQNGGRIRPQCQAAINRNRRPDSAGLGGRVIPP